MIGRIARWFDRNLPTREDLAGNRWLAPVGQRFLSPELWRFTRRSVPRGVALGLFAGFIIPIGQIVLAALLAWPARANVPIAVLVTFVTNPFTIPFWVVVANRLGAFILKINQATVQSQIGEQIQSGRWFEFGPVLQTAGVTAFGFMVMAVLSAAIGYIVSSLIWRWWISRKLQARRRRPGKGGELAG